MVIHQLLPDLFLHAGQREVGASEVACQVGERLLHQVLDAEALVLGDAGRQAEPIDVPADTDPGGVDRRRRVDRALDLGDVHVAGVRRVSGDAMIFLDQRIENIGENLKKNEFSSN